MTDAEQAPPLAVAPVTRGRGHVASLVEAARPRQWVKNLLVVAAPVAAGDLLRPRVLGDTVVAFVVFVLASAGTYLVNDVRDAAGDREHEVKRSRPIARGDVTPALATWTAAVLLTASVVVPAALHNGPLTACLATYVALMLAYSLRLKDEAVLDLAVVASGFLLRAMAGGLAAHIPLSRWFLTVAAFGSLFVVAGKRYSELVALGGRAVLVRKSHGTYSPTYLRFVWTVAVSVLLTTYCLWAFEVGARTAKPWSAVSVAPFVVGVLRYARDVDQGQAGEPEEIFLRDRMLQLVGAVWLVVFALGAAGG